MHHLTAKRLAALLLAVGALLGACGNGGGPTGEALALRQPDPDALVPSAPVIDLDSGDEVDFASFLPSDRPVLVWFWAPH